MEFFIKFINIFKNINLKIVKHKYRKYLKTSNSSGGVKNFVGSDFSARFDVAFQDRKKEVQNKVEHIIKKAKNNPYRLVAYVEKHGTPVYRIKNANKILALINESEGFITPKRGIKALYLNLIINKKISFEFSECFVMRNLALEPYVTIHQFYNWYAFKSGFAGYEFEAQEKLKSIITSKNSDSEVRKLGISDILAVKEAVRRDIEALNFVIKLAKNTEGAKKAFEKMITKTASVSI